MLRSIVFLVSETLEQESKAALEVHVETAQLPTSKPRFKLPFPFSVSSQESIKMRFPKSNLEYSLDKCLNTISQSKPGKLR